MKIGIYFPDFKPEDGGANTLLGTILRQIEKDDDSRYEYVVLYKGESNKVETINNIKYIDLGYLFGTSFLTKAIRKLREDLFNYSILDKIAKEEKIDLYYFPEHPNVNVTVPYIYTVWDLGHRTTPQFPEVSENGEWNRRENLYLKMLPNASYIITGNETGKKEITKYYQINDNKIRICEFPVSDFCFGYEKKPSFISDNNYFFYPAQFWSHKNHICIIEALKILKEEHNLTPTIYFTGSDKGYKSYIQSKIREYQLVDQIILTGFVTDEELKYMYTHARAMIFASMMGPNNLPPIEATFLHCPVIITDLEGHVEQLGDSACYFDGNNARDLALKIKKIACDDNYRNSLIEKEKILGEKFANINYFSQIKIILDDYFENK